jgi:hypothetical protein
MAKAQAQLQRIKPTLVGLPVTHVWRGYGSSLFLEFGELHPRTRRDGSQGNSQGEMGLMIHWSWRIEGPRSILCGSWSNERRWPAAFARLLDARVLEISIFGRLPEIDLGLSNGLHVVSLMTAEGQPQWTLFDRHDRKNQCWVNVKRGVLCFETTNTARARLRS